MCCHESAEEYRIPPVLTERQYWRGFQQKKMVAEIALRIYCVYDCLKEIIQSGDGICGNPWFSSFVRWQSAAVAALLRNNWLTATPKNSTRSTWSDPSAIGSRLSKATATTSHPSS